MMKPIKGMAKAFGVSSFTTVGHLLHINLKEHLLQHKNQIGEALLKQNPRALAVVNKVSSIDNEFRNFDVEIIARREGCQLSDDELMVVNVNENKCRFRLDFSKVYWNSRLSTEHERFLEKLNKKHDIVFDLFAGVGPFSVPAAKAKCKTYANDLNPESVKWLEVNMELNKVSKELYEIFNLDAKEFIPKVLKQKLFEEYEQIIENDWAIKPKIHILMNLPALAPTFLTNFAGLFRDDTSTKINGIELRNIFQEQSIEHVIYCYCFLKGNFDDPKKEVQNLIETEFGRKLNDKQLKDIFRVRNVAPYKDMYRVEIRLDEKILFEPKNLVGIMRNHGDKSSQTPNGTPKKVTIRMPIKRSLQDTPDIQSSEDNQQPNNVSAPKKARAYDYCEIM